MVTLTGAVKATMVRTISSFGRLRTINLHVSTESISFGLIHQDALPLNTQEMAINIKL